MATGPTGSSTFAKALAGLTSTTNPYAIPTTTETQYLTQTSQPDIESMVNGLFQQLVGRYASPKEIKQYGAELLAAEKANPGLYRGETTYQQSGKRATVTGTQLSAGVAAQEFLQNQVKQSKQAGDFQSATTAFDLLTQMAKSDAGAA
jgi:hypothetical protein